MQPLHIALRWWSRVRCPTVTWNYWGALLGRSKLRAHLRSREGFALLSKPGCPHWSMPGSIPLVAGGETEVSLSPGPCGCLPLWVNAPGRCQPLSLVVRGWWYLPILCWEPGNLCLPGVSVAISVPPVCWENVRTSPDSLQSQELHCLNLCQLCF